MQQQQIITGRLPPRPVTVDAHDSFSSGHYGFTATGRHRVVLFCTWNILSIEASGAVGNPPRAGMIEWIKKKQTKKLLPNYLQGYIYASSQ